MYLLQIAEQTSWRSCQGERQCHCSWGSGLLARGRSSSLRQDSCLSPLPERKKNQNKIIDIKKSLKEKCLTRTYNKSYDMYFIHKNMSYMPLTNIKSIKFMSYDLFFYTFGLNIVPWGISLCFFYYKIMKTLLSYLRS